MSEIAQNLDELKKTLPDTVKLVAVSKTKPVEVIREAYEAGHRVFGENRVQEMIEKAPQLPDDIEWHLIGHLQTNKVKYIAPFVHLIHSVDSIKLIKEISKQATKNNRTIDVLLQIHIAEEDSKFGFDPSELKELIVEGGGERDSFYVPGVRFRGVMGIATFTDDMDQVREEYQTMFALFKSLKENIFKNSKDFNELSMGMTGDFMVAIEEGSTMVRIGTRIFGSRY